MSGSPYREFHRTLTSAFRYLNVLQRGEKRCFGVTMPQCLLIEILSERGPMTVGELAEHLGLDTSTVTRLVDVLARDRLLSRYRDENGDRRHVYVSLTAKGTDLGRQLIACADAYCGRILERIPEKNRAAVLSALDVLLEALEQLPENQS